MKPDLTHLPQTSGVYLFKDSRGAIIYIGKALNLEKRVKQHFLMATRGWNEEQLAIQVARVNTIETASEFDALLLEASLIRRHKPKYNVIARDDKSPLYIALSLWEELPRVLYLRGKQLPLFKTHKNNAIFGPFQSSRIARSLMRDLRQSIPYCTQKRRTGVPCFYTHIGLCSPCPSYVTKLPQNQEKNKLKKEYRTNIFRLRDILSGDSSKVLRQFEREMRKEAQEEHFEAAGAKKQQIDALYSLYSRRYDVSLYETSNDTLSQMGKTGQQALYEVLAQYIPQVKPLRRIECVDISNISGKQATGSVVICEDGIIDPSQFKRFRIRIESGAGDVGMIDEVLRRRFAHPEWPYPELLVVDGGKGQLGQALEVIKKLRLDIAAIGLAKRLEEIVVLNDNQFRLLRLPLTSPAIHLLQRIRDEAHRFALAYHRKLRSRVTFATMKAR